MRSAWHFHRSELRLNHNPDMSDYHGDGVAGSAILKERIEIEFARFARRHGIRSEEARHLLLNTGVRLPA